MREGEPLLDLGELHRPAFARAIRIIGQGARSLLGDDVVVHIVRSAPNFEEVRLKLVGSGVLRQVMARDL